MDEVKAEIKQKEIVMKELKAQKKRE